MASPEKCGYLVVSVRHTECRYGNGPRAGEVTNHFRVAASSARLREVVGSVINHDDLMDVDGHSLYLEDLPRDEGLFVFLVEDISNDSTYCLEWLTRLDGSFYRRATDIEAIAIAKGEALSELAIYREWAGVSIGEDERQEEEARRLFSEHLTKCDGCGSGFPCEYGRARAAEH